MAVIANFSAGDDEIAGDSIGKPYTIEKIFKIPL
jgi:hypothetical protein